MNQLRHLLSTYIDPILLHLIYFIQEIVFLTHYFTIKVEWLPYLVLLDSDFSVRVDWVEVLLNFEGNVLCQPFHRILRPLTKQVIILYHPQKASVSLFKQKFALLLEEFAIDVSFFDVVVVVELDYVDGQREGDDFGHLIDSLLHIINKSHAKNILHKVTERR